MNVHAVRRGETEAAEGDYAHVPSMLEDVRARRADRGGLHHRRARPRGRTRRRSRPAPHRHVPPRQGARGSAASAERREAMRVCVVGCGAVGSLFAAELAQLDDVEVWAYDLDAEHVDGDQRARPADLRRRRARRPRAARRPTPRSSRPATSASSPRRACTPSAAMAGTAHAFAGGAVCSVQNGAGNEELVAEHVQRGDPRHDLPGRPHRRAGPRRLGHEGRHAHRPVRAEPGADGRRSRRSPTPAPAAACRRTRSRTPAAPSGAS